MTVSTGNITTKTPGYHSVRTLDRKGRKAVEKKAQQLRHLTIEYVPTSSLAVNEYNPNRQSEHDFELLCRSIEEDGFTQPVLVNITTGKIVDGEHRWRAATVLGLEEIPIVRVDMTPEQARISTLRHNRARGSEDLELSAQVLRDLQELGALDWAADSLMLDDAEMNRLLNDIPAPEALAAEAYSQAWEPDMMTGRTTAQAQSGEGTKVQESTDAHGATVLQALTPQAVDVLREREARIQEAKTQEERKMAQAEMQVYRVSLIFAGQEAEDVKHALGDEPAVKFLAICRDYLARQGQP